MDKISNLAMVIQMVEAAEKNIQSAKQMLRELAGGGVITKQNYAALSEKAVNLSVSEGGKIIEGVFDGQNMIGPDKKQYPVPANYASKSKLVEGDVLKLTIAEDGSFIYKQIGPTERKRIIGVLGFDEATQLWSVVHEGKTYKILTASATFYHGKPGDHVVILVPKDAPSSWGAVENIIAS